MPALTALFSPENHYWLTGVPKQEFYLYLELLGAQAPSDANRVPLNISLVLDRSGSMQGDKIAYVKKAAQFVIDNLTADDYLSIVQYDDVVEVLSPAGQVRHKAQLKGQVESMQARASTNLSGGLLAGYDQVQANRQEQYVNRVLLLSDGLANRGITDAAQLQQIAQTRFREQGIALSTFGVGADFDEVLMTNLSEYGGANYYFIDNPDKIPSIFAEELRGLLAVVAQNVQVDIHFPGDYFRCEKVYGFPADLQPGRAKVLFNDVFAQEKKAILIKLVATKPFDQDIEVSATLRYASALGNFAQVEDVLLAKVSCTSEEALVLAGVQPVVVEQTALFVANDLFEAVVRLAEQRDFEAAKRAIAQIKMYLEKHFQTMPPREELLRQYQQILRYEQQLDGMEDMGQTAFYMQNKMNRMSNYNARRKKPFY